MLARLMPGLSGNKAESPHLRLLAPTSRHVVFPIKPAAHHQAAVIAAEALRRDDNIGDLVTSPRVIVRR